MKRFTVLSVVLLSAAVLSAQGGPPIGVPRQPLGAGPWTFDTAEQHGIRVSVVASGLQNPWSLAFLPNGDMLVTERPGRLRLIRNGVLDPQPVAGLPKVGALRLGGLQDIVLHPQFATNNLIYFTYTKPGETAGLIANTLGRARWDGTALVDAQELLVVDPFWNGAGGAASRLAFGRDGMLYMSTGASAADQKEAQNPAVLRGKMLRLRDDGKPAPDNPFVGRSGYRPEIFSLGHRNTLGLAVHPESGAIWNAEQGPNGGDKLNVITRGGNYGWPEVSLGRAYEGPWQGEFARSGIERPQVVWVPSIAVSGLAFYTGDRFPAWKGNAIVGALRMGEIANTGHLQRVVFNGKGEEIRREMLLTDLRQRIRDVKQGPDGLLYLLTEENPGAVLKVEPVPLPGAPADRPAPARTGSSGSTR